MTYSIQYFDHSGILYGGFSRGDNARAAIANFLACEPRAYRVISCKPRPRGKAK